MSKNDLTLIILITIAVVLNSLVLGMLVSPSSVQNAATVTSPSPTTFSSTGPSPTPYVTATPSPIPYSVNIPSPSLSPNTDKLTITNVQTNASAGTFLVSVLNSGSSDIVITGVYVNGYLLNLEEDVAITANSSISLILTLTRGITVGNTYQIKLLSSEGSSSTYYIIA
ncbi:MAG: hypothetical protein NT043_05845 [Candidatus Bathyarchaeota archaeon]|nr:hypothetical protein [Candidatus Bathyarchaeota archaeon]